MSWLRATPELLEVARSALRETTIGGLAIHKDEMVVIAPWLLHRDPRYFEDPLRFDPDRFLGANREKIDRWAYIPFGAGPRVCIGMTFALQEAVIVLAHMLKAFRFDLWPGQVVTPQQRITLRPRDGMKMVARKRA